MTVPNLRIILDMDEVLSDFTFPAARCHGISEMSLTGLWTNQKWGLDSVVSSIIDRELSWDQFWEPINKQGIEFWDSLPVLTWAYELIHHVSRLTPDWFIISSHSSQHENEYQGKRKWMTRFLALFFGIKDISKFIPTEHKWLVANRNTILIDDRPDNLTMFEKHLGKTIMFPYIGNRLSELRVNPMPYVKGQLQTLIEGML